MSKDNSLQVDNEVANTSSNKLRWVKSRGRQSQGPSCSSFTSASKFLCRAFNSAALLFENDRHKLSKLFISFWPGTPFTNQQCYKIPTKMPTFGMLLLTFICYTITVLVVYNRNIFNSRVDDHSHFSFLLMYAASYLLTLFYQLSLFITN